MTGVCKTIGIAVCMPCTPVSSEAVREGRIPIGQSGAESLRSSRVRSVGIWGHNHYLSHWSSGVPDHGLSGAWPLRLALLQLR